MDKEMATKKFTLGAAGGNEWLGATGSSRNHAMDSRKPSGTGTSGDMTRETQDGKR